MILLNEINRFSLNAKDKIIHIDQVKELGHSNDIGDIKRLVDILIYIHNNIHKMKYKDIYETSERLFMIFNVILFNFTIFT